MSESDSSNFPNILKEIIKKSLFTERQIEIILKQKKMIDVEFGVSKGAYYRQVSQARSNIDVISRLTEQLSVIKDGDVFPEREREILGVIERVVKQTTSM